MFSFFKKMLVLLSRRERIELYWLFATMTLLATIEVASIGSIMPFMTAVANPDLVESNKWLGGLYNFFHFESQNSFLLFLGTLVLVILILSNASTALITWWIFHYSWGRNHSIANRLFAMYLSEPYVFFLNRNTSELTKNILDEVLLIVTGILNSSLMVVKSSVVILFVCMLLIIMDPMLAFIVSMTLGIAYICLFYASSKVLHRIGQERAKANVKRFKYVNEALGGIKVLRVLGREKYFLDQFSEHSARVSKNFAQKMTIAQLPRYAFEVIAFGGVLIIILYFLATEKDVEHIIPMLALYAFAGYRLMPSMQTVFDKAANLRYTLPSLDILYDEICNSQANSEVKSSSGDSSDFKLENEGIRLNEVSFSYPEQENSVLDKLNMFIPVNKTVGLVGATGSGKTTIIDIILGLLNPTEGELLVDDRKVNTSNTTQWQKQIGYVPQDIFLTDESVTRNIAFGIVDSEINKDAVINAAKVANLHEFITNELPDSYDTVVGERGVRISGGQKQRIGIARALYHDPDVLILDEATSALDGVTEDAIMQAINNLSHQKTIIMIAHRLTTLQECDEIFVLEQGEIVAKGTYHDLLTTSTYFQKRKSA
jgi:ABC-type multidrug transport system fused ATPase/permease subunit